MTAGQATFYITGGTLRHDAPSYVERKADRELLDGLLKGEFCYVLTSRQMGKSSLMVRTASKLRDKGVAVVVLDLTAIGQNVTPEQWYDGLLTRIGAQLALENELEAFWQRTQRVSPVQRFFSAIREVLLQKIPGNLVVFVDETDTVRSLTFSTDEFFAAIRECYNRRTEDAQISRMTFCLLGVATPSDLIRDTRLTPFNIGRRIELDDFTRAETTPLAAGLASQTENVGLLLDRILHWTNGHPYLTQRLCRAISEVGNGNDRPSVERICDDIFLSARARERDDNLIFVRERLLNSEADRASLLDLYLRIWKGKRITDDEANPLVSVLKLSGVVRSEGGCLRTRNSVYEKVFDRRWIMANMPDQERRRQRAAFRRGMIGAAVALLILGVFLSLPLFKPVNYVPAGFKHVALPDTKLAVNAPANATPSAPVSIPSPTNLVQFANPTLTNSTVVGRTPVPTRESDKNVVIVEVRGGVEFLPAGSQNWYLARAGQVLQPGDALRTKEKSAVVLKFSDQSLFRLNELSHIRISGKPATGLEIIKGVLDHFFRTPSATGVIRG
jgi:hypothetical protein